MWYCVLINECQCLPQTFPAKPLTINLITSSINGIIQGIELMRTNKAIQTLLIPAHPSLHPAYTNYNEITHAQ